MENSKGGYLSELNDNQLEAVSHINGPLLILAGAGTGKTKVLTSRIIHILNNNIAFPSQILAVTFTNKAANEMKQRVDKFLENVTSSMNIGTFHSIAAKILRRHAELLGYTSGFTIINQDDQLRVTKQLIKDYNLDEKSVSPKVLLYYINRFKDRAIIPENVSANEAEHFALGKLNKLYTEYQNRLKNFNAMDFGDLLLNNIQLFNNNLDICLYYQNKFKYILVDEYQDTNIAQYLWLRTLSQNNNNICCVGDDDQSIYAWRGAEITNILRFDKDYPNAKVVRLEKNYRSTQHILNLASKLIANNTNRHSKNLWTDRTDGDKVKVINYYDDKEEARAIADEIDMLERLKKTTLSDIAILVRAGYQTRNFEESLNFLGVPYRIVGSTKFYDRLEIKDCIGYIRLLVNKNDNLAFERVVNTPKRGVGNSALMGVLNVAKEQNISMFDAAKGIIGEKKVKGKAIESLNHFITLIEESNSNLGVGNHAGVVKVLLNKAGYIDMWKNDDRHESRERIDNINELINSLSEYENLQEFLEYISLISDADNVAEDNRVNIMTIHAAKGLEFDTVFLPGWEEGVFPSSKSIEEKKESGLEEERRLAYVAITRAKRNLSISYACYRRIYGDFQASEISRFVNELPKDSYQLVNNYFNSSLASAQKNAISFKDVRKENYKPVKKEKFSVGTKVLHIKFGRGIVLSAEGDIKEIFFEKEGVKKIMSEFLELI
ncbi:UvrD-helicase domain-containing protein [Candidatus Bandiella numerosa]|jgi:DNA helicase-2/ATP-dependent DNA helicase PcrA|nr:UvrD-helicase domain-containing protein [Candidatus Bandiella numerosa]WHA05568.1 UvrD-helicase domain-containing protein [Candidatus Bandiella numerosa]